MAEHNKEKHMFVYTGPDGSGRKTVADAVGLTLGLRKVISYTTRKKRPVEEDGQDYHFVSEEAFENAVKNGEFIENLVIDGNRYGIKKKDIEQLFEKGNVFLILNRRGADILRDIYGDRVVRIFVYADRDTVANRLKQRGLEPFEIEQRLSHFDEDMAYGPSCEHSVENIGDLGHTAFHVTNLLEHYLKRDLVDKD
jgi:guanylate kinase